MTTDSITENFEGTDISISQVGGSRWVRGQDVCRALGFADPVKAMEQILKRNRAEFDSTTTCMIDVFTGGQVRTVRLYNARGAALIAMKAQTPKGDAFRRWVLDVLEGTVDAGPVAAGQNIPAAVHKRLCSMFLGSRGNGALIRYRTMGLGGAEIAKLLEVSRVNVVERIRVAEFLGLVAVDPALEAYRLKPQFLKFQEARRKSHAKTAEKLKAQKALAAPAEADATPDAGETTDAR